MSENSKILIIEELYKSFGKVMPICNLSFEVQPGEILGIIGPNGAGKTTLFNLISGHFKPDKGRILFNGEEITFAPGYKRCRIGIARTFQVPRPFVNMTVWENLLVGAFYGSGLKKQQQRERCEAVLTQTGLISKRHVITDTLPLLDRKRLELARALATQPKVLLVDEVAGGLTEAEVEEVLRIIHQIRDADVTILWVEHIMMAMQKGPDQLLVINFGEKLFYGPPQEAFDNKEVQEIYLGTEDHGTPA
jgi:branched-chain amino acid transport system ATP-binding protein